MELTAAAGAPLGASGSVAAIRRPARSVRTSIVVVATQTLPSGLLLRPSTRQASSCGSRSPIGTLAVILLVRGWTRATAQPSATQTAPEPAAADRALVLEPAVLEPGAAGQRDPGHHGQGPRQCPWWRLGRGRGRGCAVGCCWLAGLEASGVEAPGDQQEGQERRHDGGVSQAEAGGLLGPGHRWSRNCRWRIRVTGGRAAARSGRSRNQARRWLAGACRAALRRPACCRCSAWERSSVSHVVSAHSAWPARAAGRVRCTVLRCLLALRLRAAGCGAYWRSLLCWSTSLRCSSR
jgi:hypothetical protein